MPFPGGSSSGLGAPARGQREPPPLVRAAPAGVAVARLGDRVALADLEDRDVISTVAPVRRDDLEQAPERLWRMIEC